MSIERAAAIFGYARCSTKEQNLEDQIRRLHAAGCVYVFKDEGVSGMKASRPDWDRCLAHLVPGDVLKVTKLDRAGRSLRHLLELVDDLNERGVGFATLDQQFDTTSASGKMIFTIIAAFAEFEKALNLERTMEGLHTAWSNGKKSGQPPKLTPEKEQSVPILFRGGQTITAIARSLDVHQATIYRTLRKLGIEY
jgi:DNA invertase Pin-like site-specific DNA recombinase